MQPKRGRWAWLAGLVLPLGLALLIALPHTPVAAQTTVPETTPQRAPILVDGHTLFHVRGLADYSAAERARSANRSIRAQIRHNPGPDPIPVTVVEDGGLTSLRLAQRHLLTITGRDLVGGLSRRTQAQLWQERLGEALQQAQWERTGEYRLRSLRRLLLSAIAVMALSLGMRQLRRRLRRNRSYRSSTTAAWMESGVTVLELLLWLGFALWAVNLVPESRAIVAAVWRFCRDVLTMGLITLGRKTVSVLDLTLILGLAVCLWIVVRSVTLLISTRLLNQLGISREAKDSITLLIQITLIALGLLMLVQAIGVNIASLAIPLSVLGVGVGFGLQNIANNFISGVIIKLERPVKVGDFVKLDELTGTVERIGLRSTEIQTLDRITIIIPNALLIESKVVNWSHGVPVSRLQMPLGVAYGSPIQKLREVVLEAAAMHPKVLRYPKPQLWFEGFGDSSLDFNLLIWICEPRIQARIRSDLYYLVEANLRLNGIEIPFPQRDLHLRSTPPGWAPPASASPDPSAAAGPSPSAGPSLAEVMDWTAILEQADHPTDAELSELAEMMAGPEGVAIADRRFGLHVYPSCFIGQEAVEWLMQQQQASREEALRLGRLLVDRCVIQHVTDEHDFEDDYLFYRFVQKRADRSDPESSGRDAAADT